MGVLSLNVHSAEKGVTKTLQFEPDKLVLDVCRQIRQKLPLNNINPDEYGLFRVDEDPTKGAWLDNSRTLEYYLIRNQDRFEYKKKIRNQRIRMLDNSTKVVQVDESQPVGRLMVTICTKIGIANHEEYSLVRDKDDPVTASTLNLREERSRSQEPTDKQQKAMFMGTLTRKKEKKLEQLKSTLHTDEELPWVDHGRTLREQGISEEETLVLRRKFFYSDTNVDSRDPVQLNLLYVQCRDGILRGQHPVSKETACDLAALQAQAEYGDFPRNNPKFHVEGRDLLPKEYGKNKDNDKIIMEKYKELSGLSELEAKSKYVHLCRGLKTYGVTFFVVKEKVRGKNKLVPRLLGVNKDSVMRVDEKTKDILKEWPLEQVRKWAPGPKTFTLDFGDYQEGYYAVQTADGDKIAQLIAGYIDIILKKRQTRDHLGIEGDEGSTMLEDVVTPARATLVSHGQIGSLYAQDGNVALRGVMRTPQSQNGYGIHGAQYGAVSGEITTNDSMGRAQRTRIIDTYQQPQRALIGTIETTIRAVERAEEELEREPEIEIPKFHDDNHARKWVEEQVAVNKENVNERLAAMGAATAQVVQWTAVQEEYDDRVGTAIATIGSNLPDVGRNIRDLSHLIEERRGGDLVDAARRLCGAFGDFLHSVNPEHQEKRQTVLAAASKVGEFSQRVVNTMEDKTIEEETFHEQLVTKAKNVATSTAQLVLRAKTISAECDEKQLQDNVIHSATQCAFATSQLVACTRVVAPTMESNACQQQLTNAAKHVSTAVDELLIDAKAACQRSPAGQTSYTDLYEAASQVTTALDGLLDHVKTSPRIRKTVEEEEYHKLLRTTNRLIAHKGPSEDLTREARKVIRHSQILQEQLETEAFERPEQRDKLLDAARRVATATSQMIDATRECESRPTEAESEVALRKAAEEMASVTHESTSERQAKYIMERLEQAATQTAYEATQAITAANASKEVIHSKTTQETLVYECTETAGHMPGMITSIRESAKATTSAEKFRAQSRLIRDATHILQAASRLAETSSSAVSEVTEPHLASNLQQASHGLSTALAELRTALNDARQLNFSQQLYYTEDLIRELDTELQTTHREAQAGRLAPFPGMTASSATSKLMSAARQVGSGVAQLVSAGASHDEQHVGASSVEAAHALRIFTGAVKEVVATRKDIELDSVIVESRSVVHDSGRVFDRVRENAPPPILAEAAKQVSVSLKKVISCLPDTQHVEKAINQIRTIGTATTIREPDVRVAASRLVEATSHLQAAVRQPGESEAVDIFVRCYTDFHTSAIASIKQQQIPIQERAQRHEEIENVRTEAIELLQRMATPSEASYLSQTSTHFTESVNRFITHISAEHPLEKECDAALRKLQSVRHLTEQATVPLSESSYWGSLSTITENSRRLGEAITEVARAVKTNDMARTCDSIRSYANTMYSMTEAASHSAYLVGVSHPKSVRGQQALIDAGAVKKSALVVRQIASKIEENKYTRDELMEDGTIIAKHTSVLANLCRNASERAVDVNVKKQFINCAKEIANCTSHMISAVKDLDKQRNSHTESVCSSTATTLRQAAENLESFVDNPAFAAVPARISPEGRSAQIPVLASSRQMLDASCEMVSAMRQLAGPRMDDTAWQRVADQSRVVSDSIKRLVTSINDATPGVIELERTIQLLENLLIDVDRLAMDAAQNPPQPNPAEEKRAHQHILHVIQALAEKVNTLRTAAVEKGEELGHCAEEHWALIERLASSTCKAAAIASDSRRQAELFNQCKTVIEAELALMTACLNSRGNPSAAEHHRAVDEYSAQLKDALAELRVTVNRISSEQGTIQGLVETISHSIASSDVTPPPADGSFADAQTRMTAHLEAIRSTATDIPFAEAERLNNLVLQLSENYRKFVVDSNQAVKLINSPNLGQKLKVAGQKLGTACIDTVRVADIRKKYPQDQQTQRELTDKSRVVIERVDEVLAALHEGSKGTQACINAANTVSGIIGDLDTTILFATSGSLNPAEAKDFGSHKEAILKTAKALVEDTKALVAGAASNQEQLAVAAQNAVRTIVNLSDAVKNGAISLSADNQEAQVMVIHSVRDVCSALSILIQATKNAVGRSLHDPAMNNLKDAAKTMVTNVTSLLKTVKSVEDKQNQGSRALEAAIEAIRQEIEHYDRETGENLPGTSSISQDALAVAGQRVAEVAHRVVGASQSQSTQGDVIAAANMARAAVGDVLAVSRAAAASAETPEGRYRILDCGRDVAMQLRGLMVTLHNVLRTGEVSHRQLLAEASRGVAKSVRDLVGCSELLRGDEWAEADVIANATAGAEKELLVAANSIQQASVKLAELRPRQQPAEHQMEPRDTFDGQILHAATSISNAVHTLVKAASVAQRELIAQGRLEPSSRGGDDYQWSEGLISAARFVVGAVHQLCDAANALVQGQSSEEKLISAAKQVASSTAQLLIACNVKADIDSQARKRLQAAGHAVKTATERLVESARHAVIQDDRNIIIADRMVHGIAQVLSAKEEVARKEKELTLARQQLATIHKARYEREGSPPQ